MFQTYDTMTTTARRHPEGSLVYVLDQTDLFLRVRDGVRQVHVTKSSFNPRSAVVFSYVHAAAVFPAGQLRRPSCRREWLFPRAFKAPPLRVFTPVKRVFRTTRSPPWSRLRWSSTRRTPTPTPPSRRVRSTDLTTHIPSIRPTRILATIQTRATLPPQTPGTPATRSA